MRIDAALAALAIAAACGGARSGERRGGGVATCGDYAVAVRRPLARLARAAERFGDVQLGGLDEAAAGATRFAATLDEERRALAAIRIGRRDLASAHAGLPAALARMRDAMRTLADVVRRRDEGGRETARSRLADANRGWGEAVASVRAICPID